MCYFLSCQGSLTVEVVTFLSTMEWAVHYRSWLIASGGGSSAFCALPCYVGLEHGVLCQWMGLLLLPKACDAGMQYGHGGYSP